MRPITHSPETVKSVSARQGELNPVARILRAIRSFVSGLEGHDDLLAGLQVFHGDGAVRISGFQEPRGL